MINIFLDSNILYGDPLMKNGFNSLLLEKVNRMGGKIFICDIVYKEVLNNYRRDLKNINDGITKVNREITRKTYLEPDIELVDEDKEINKLDQELKRHIDNGEINLLEVNDSLMPELIDRAVHRRKPFTEKKQEFRDCLIWLTYAKYVEEKSLQNCILITSNTADFCDQQGNLHEDLLEDTNRFRFYKTIHDFFEKQGEVLSKMQEDAEGIKDYQVEEVQFDKNKQEIQVRIQEFFNRIPARGINELYGISMADTVKIKDIKIERIKRGGVDVNTEKLKITEIGTLEVVANVQLVDDFFEQIIVDNTEINLEIVYIAKRQLEKIQIEELYNYKVKSEFCSIEVGNIKIKTVDRDVLTIYQKEVECDERADMMDVLENNYSH